MTETRWFAVQTKPQLEHLAIRSVPNDRIERFFPRCKPCAAALRLGIRAVKPLFPGYLFARFCPALDLDRVRYARGVLRVVNSGGVPIPIEDETIQEQGDRLSGGNCMDELALSNDGM